MGLLKPIKDEAATEGRPGGFLVVDDILGPETLSAIQDELRNPSFWTEVPWKAEFPEAAAGFREARSPQFKTALGLKSDVRVALGGRVKGMSIVSCWILECSTDRGVPLHADNAEVIFNLWLTPPETPLKEGTGGLEIFDARRPSGSTQDEFTNANWAERYIRSLEPTVRSHVIDHRPNRAMVFDAHRFHRSIPPVFCCDSPAVGRVNLSVAFGHPETVAALAAGSA